MFKRLSKNIKSIFGFKKIPNQPKHDGKELKYKHSQKNKNQTSSNKDSRNFEKKKNIDLNNKPEYKKAIKRKDQKINIVHEEIKANWNANEFKVEPISGKSRFHDFELPENILHGIFDLGFEYCTDVQAETLPKALFGEDVTAQAQTGTGKTAAFLITLFSYFIKNPIDSKRKKGTPRALILAPTRELVMQIEKDARAIGKYVDFEILSLLGGIDYGKQQSVLKSNEIDILVCTPGRLLDFMQKKIVNLRKIEILVIDEADRMLDMGFIPSVKKIVYELPQKSKRQTMFFSATMTSDVKRLAKWWTRQATEITIQPEEIASETIEQITYITTVEEKPTLLYNIITQKKLEKVLIFANRRDQTRRLTKTLEDYGISCVLLSGDVDQRKRINRLERFRDGKVRVLVATDVASRGIHVDSISHVINYNMPQDVEDYVHRIGRTGRAGESGISITFADEEDSYELMKLEEYLGRKIDCVYPEDELLKPIPEDIKVKSVKSTQRNNNSSNRKNKKKYPPRKSFNNKGSDNKYKSKK